MMNDTGQGQSTEYKLEQQVGDAVSRLDKIYSRLYANIDKLHGSQPQPADSSGAKAQTVESNSVRSFINRIQRQLSSIENEIDRLERFL